MERHSHRAVVVSARIFGAALAATLLIGAVKVNSSPADPFPADVKMRCPAGNSKLSFDNWFAGNKVTVGGMVNPADSDASTPGLDGYPEGIQGADLYRWAVQMFLHVTSPVGGTSLPVFASPEFYALSPADPKTGQRTFIEQSAPTPPVAEVRKAKPATDDYSIIHDSLGTLYIVVPKKLAASGNPLVTDKTGRELEVSGLTVDGAGHGSFLMANGAPLTGVKPEMSAEAATLLAGRLITPGTPPPTVPPKTTAPITSGQKAIGISTTINTKPITNHPKRKLPMLTPIYRFLGPNGYVFTDSNGAVVTKLSPEVTQADGSVQLTRSYNVNGKSERSLVYYTLAYNDAFAYTRTMEAHGQMPPDYYDFQTPGTPYYPGGIEAVNQYAKGHGHSITHPSALVLELKMAWVEAAAVTNPSDYITIQAKIPSFDTSNPKHWVQNGTKMTELALVGMHIVGSTFENSIGIWATFEHQSNTPNDAYSYINTSGGTVNMAAVKSDGGSYLFGMPGSTSNKESQQARMTSDKSGSITIDGVGGNDIQGASVYHLSPYGCPSDEAPNSFDHSPAESNTTIVSLNRDVYERMPDGDPRKNYYLVGATWDLLDIPDGPSLLWTQTAKPWHGPADYDTDIEGTPFVANSTMETFEQAASYQDGGADYFKVSGGGGIGKDWTQPWTEQAESPATGCFSCHSGGSDMTMLSHVFHNIKPLW